MCRRDFKAVLTVMQYEDSSSESSSSDENDLDFLLCELAFKPNRVLGPCLNLMDLSDLQCEQLFRYNYMTNVYTCGLVCVCVCVCVQVHVWYICLLKLMSCVYTCVYTWCHDHYHKDLEKMT